MNVRIARKILIDGRPSDPSSPGRPSRYERKARRMIVRRWKRYSYVNGCFSEEGEARCHADHRALTASDKRWLGRKS